MESSPCHFDPVEIGLAVRSTRTEGFELATEPGGACPEMKADATA